MFPLDSNAQIPPAPQAGRSSVSISLPDDHDAVRRYRDGLSGDVTEQALLALVTKVVLGMGHHTGFALQAARLLGVGDAELVEVIALVGMNTFVTDLTSIAQTALDHTPLES